jgi:hypothetical protein
VLPFQTSLISTASQAGCASLGKEGRLKNAREKRE